MTSQIIYFITIITINKAVYFKFVGGIQFIYDFNIFTDKIMSIFIMMVYIYLIYSIFVIARN